MEYTARNFDVLLGTEGFSDDLLKDHFKLYQGYVKNAGILLDSLSDMRKKKRTAEPIFGELKRRLGWEWNGMRMHELYFEGMKKGGAAALEGGPLASALTESFGSRAEWEAEFRATGMMRGIGWAVMTLDPGSGLLANVWVNEHDAGHWAGCAPLLVMDVFEHAYMPEYGLRKEDYIGFFLRAVDWRCVERRFSASGAGKRKVAAAGAR